MRPISGVLAAVGGLVVGIAATWLFTHHDAMKSTASSAPASSDKKALYWYDPMVPAQHFDKPGKSPFMDMQLVPKYAGGESSDSAGVVQIDPRQVQNLGLRTAKVARGALQATVRATGTVAFDERTVTVVQARVAGIVERLDVRAPLTAVKQGQPLLTLLAPDWTAAQEEYLSLRRMQSGGLDDLRNAARQRLLLLGMREGQIRAIERSGQSQARITITRATRRRCWRIVGPRRRDGHGRNAAIATQRTRYRLDQRGDSGSADQPRDSGIIGRGRAARVSRRAVRRPDRRAAAGHRRGDAHANGADRTQQPRTPSCARHVCADRVHGRESPIGRRAGADGSGDCHGHALGRHRR